MRRLLWTGLTLVTLGLPASAHFVYVVPSPDSKAVSVVFSESLDPDDAVPVGKLAGLKLTAQRADGSTVPVELKPGEDKLTGQLPAGAVSVAGKLTYGLMSRAGAKPTLLVYHPAAHFGATKPNPDAPLAIESVPDAAGIRFRLTALGKPLGGAQGSVRLPDGGTRKVTTSEAGLTDAFPASGRYAVWLRQVVVESGEFEGQRYEEVRHYATLVSDTRPAIAPLPQGVSSLGAIAAGDTIYVYGGHAGTTHSYDTASILGTFHRLQPKGSWEALPGGPILQGLNLATHGGQIYRVGGMTARNAPGEPSDTVSVAESARFDPKANRWEDLPALPEPRSSHDVVVCGDKLVVVGGWQLRGKGAEPAWADTALVMDLTQKPLAWKRVPQPFARRALTATAVGSKVYVIAGLDADAKAHQEVAIYDIEANKWSAGPPLPGTRVGFSPAATTVAGRVVVSSSDGKLHRLSAAGQKWEELASNTSRRRVHRLVPVAGGVRLVGGAGTGGNVAELEFVALPID